ncbi:MAG: nuclear transport factor 2 family protein [Lewinellaceae bacterium]|nr:nuclear transport factor 2 family protein [Lewinellaceae bacterium]
MKTSQIFFALLMLGFSNLSAQDKWYVAVTMSAQMTVAGYDGLFSKIGAAGLTNSFSEYHAAGPGVAGGFLGFTTFSSQAQLEARLSALKPIMGASVNPVPYEVYKVIAGKNAALRTDKTIIAYFDVKGMSEAQYDQIIAGLEKAGQLDNPARMYHVSYKTPEGIKVLDVWSDADAFAAAGQTLVPIIISTGVTPPQPMIYAAHAIRVPSQADRNLDVVHSDYAAFGRGDVPTILASLTEDCNWSHVGNPAIIPFAGTFIGHAGVGRFFENVGKSIQITQFEPGNFRATDHSVTCTVKISGTIPATGKTYSNSVEQTFTFDASGKVKTWATTGDVSGLEAAFMK